MPFEREYAIYREKRLRMRSTPSDLALLLSAIWLQPNTNLLDDLLIRFLDVDETPSFLNHDYLTEQDRNNPDIMNNIAAIETVCRHIVWVAEWDDSEPIGYWLGPENMPISDAPLVALDDEGQFRLLAGRSFSEAILDEYGAYEPEAAAKLREFLIAAGIHIPEKLGQPEELSGIADPAKIHEEIYWKLSGETE